MVSSKIIKVSLIVIFLGIFVFIHPAFTATEWNGPEIEIKTTAKESVSFSAVWRAGGMAKWEFLGEEPLDEDSEDEHLIFRATPKVDYFYGDETGEEKIILFTPIEDNLIRRIIWTGQSLTGTIPEKLEELKDFYRLNLSNNQLEGEIPTRIEDFTDLKRLYLDRNLFSGEIPEEIGELENLEVLSLSNNDFEGTIPLAIGKLEKLEKLYLHNNNFSEFENLTEQDAEELTVLKNLEFLTLKNNELQKIPREIIHFEDLYSLTLKNNQLAEIFEIFEEEEDEYEMKMNKLEYLDLSDNLLGCEGYELPHQLGDIEGLKELKSYHNYREWHPRRISIDLRYNCLSFIPESIGTLSALDSLRLDNNSLEGFTFLDENEEKQKSTQSQECKEAIPTTIKNLEDKDNKLKFTLLSLYNNRLTGTIPKEIGELEELVTLRLHNNKLEGNIPNELLDLNKLTTLNIENNQLDFASSEDEDDEEVFEDANAKQLQWFFAGRNEIESIPNNLELPSIRFAYLEENELEELPEDFGRIFGGVSELTLYKNKLEELPDSFENVGTRGMVNIGSGGNLYYLDLGSNLFEEFPKEITELTNLRYLNLARQTTPDFENDQFQGKMEKELPEEITGLAKLRVFLIQNNLLTALPEPEESGEDWENMSKLVYFYVQNNQVENLPEKMGKLKSLERLYLNNNQIETEIPNELTQSESLERIYLQFNNLTGKLPENSDWQNLERFLADENTLSGGVHSDFVENLKSIKFFSVFKNNLDEEISDKISSMTSLSWWDMALNELQGSLPAEIEDLQHLEVLDFNNNEIESVPDEINNARSLVCLYGFENQIEEFATSIEDLINLRNFDFHENSITTEFPDGTEDLRKLVYFSFGENGGLEGTVQWEDWETNLPEDMLFLNNNQLEGKVTSGMRQQIGGMTAFNIRDNHFEGSFSD